MHLKEGMRGYLVDLSICIPLKGEVDAGLAALKDTTDSVLSNHFLSQASLSFANCLFCVHVGLFQATNFLVKKLNK